MALGQILRIRTQHRAISSSSDESYKQKRLTGLYRPVDRTKDTQLRRKVRSVPGVPIFTLLSQNVLALARAHHVLYKGSIDVRLLAVHYYHIDR